jgi:hypothetical protein
MKVQAAQTMKTLTQQTTLMKIWKEVPKYRV